MNGACVPSGAGGSRTPQERIDLALLCLVPIYDAVLRSESNRRWWRPWPAAPAATSTLILAERVRRALTDGANLAPCPCDPPCDEATA